MTKTTIKTATKTTTIPTVVALAARLRVARSTVHTWTALGMPRRPDGGFDLPAVEAWRAERDREADGGDRAYWRTRRERADALISEDRLGAARGELIAKRDHEELLGSLVESFVSGLENLPPRVVPMLTAARGREEIDTILRDAIRSLRIQLAAKHAPAPDAPPDPTS